MCAMDCPDSQPRVKCCESSSFSLFYRPAADFVLSLRESVVCQKYTIMSNCRPSGAESVFISVDEFTGLM